MKEAPRSIPKPIQKPMTPCELVRGFHQAMVAGFQQGIAGVVLSEAAPEMAWLQRNGHLLEPKLKPKQVPIELKPNMPVTVVHDQLDHI